MPTYNNLNIDNLWNDDISDNFTNEQFNCLIMEQYKLYVEMADRASFRRIIINLFFLVFNIIVVSILALSLTRSSGNLSPALMLLPLSGLSAICYCWWRLVRYYRHMVTIKERIIGEIEMRLPASPIWKAEREVMIARGTLTPLKRIEFYMPYAFLLIYIVIYSLFII